MSKIPSITEQELRGLSPCGLDEKFLLRLEACAEETFAELTGAELEFESTLRGIRPRGVQSALVSSLTETIGDTPFAVDEKIVLFNKPNQAGQSAGKGGTAKNLIRFNIAAAAAVAILGSVAALMIPTDRPPENTAEAVQETEAENVSSGFFVPKVLPQTNFAPASFERGLSGTSDEGVLWRDANRPYRVLLHTFTDRLTAESENGETIQMEQPSYEYSLVPEKVD